MDIKHVVSGLLLVGTISLTGSGWAVAPLNTVNDGRIIKGGTYYNTPGNATSFSNSRAGGLWLKSGVTVRGLEADTNGALNNNGGTLHLYAPDNVVRLDGNINVNALRSNQGAYLGNGGKLFVDSAYLFQNGNIYANGVNGGLVQVNVAGKPNRAGLGSAGPRWDAVNGNEEFCIIRMGKLPYIYKFNKEKVKPYHLELSFTT